MVYSLAMSVWHFQLVRCDVMAFLAGVIRAQDGGIPLCYGVFGLVRCVLGALTRAVSARKAALFRFDMRDFGLARCVLDALPRAPDARAKWQYSASLCCILGWHDG